MKNACRFRWMNYESLLSRYISREGTNKRTQGFPTPLPSQTFWFYPLVLKRVATRCRESTQFHQQVACAASLTL
jgi:hypothetical protein